MHFPLFELKATMPPFKGCSGYVKKGPKIVTNRVPQGQEAAPLLWLPRPPTGGYLSPPQSPPSGRPSSRQLPRPSTCATTVNEWVDCASHCQPGMMGQPQALDRGHCPPGLGDHVSDGSCYSGLCHQHPPHIPTLPEAAQGARGPHSSAPQSITGGPALPWNRRATNPSDLLKCAPSAEDGPPSHLPLCAPPSPPLPPPGHDQALLFFRVKIFRKN